MKFKYLNLAKKISKKSAHKFQIGAVLVKDNFIISLGFNSTKTHPKSNHPYKTKHAEFDALSSADASDIKGSDVYVYRETKDGKPAISKPCQHCEKMLKSAGVKRIYYSHHEFPFWKEERYK